MHRRLGLVVDRKPAVRAVLRQALEGHGVAILEAAGSADTAALLDRHRFDLFVIERGCYDRPVAERLRGTRPEPLIVLLGEDGLQEPEPAATQAAFDVVPLPVDEQRAARLARRVRAFLELRAENERAWAEQRRREGVAGIVGCSASAERLRSRLEALARSGVPLWLVGEDGTGKEHAARVLHGASERRDGPFVVVACADDRSGLGGDELLGAAEHGTAYLEDALALPAEAQASISRLLVGAGGARDVRVVAGSREHPRRALADGRLRESLYQPFAAATLEIAALRERAEDVPLLAQSILDRISEANRLAAFRIEPDALASLERYAWPGNVRELRGALEHAAILATDGAVRVRDLPDRVRAGASRASPTTTGAERPFRAAKREVVDAFERSYLRALMQRHGGNVTLAAQHSGMLRSALQRLLRKHELRSVSFRPSGAPRAVEGRERSADADS